MKLQMKPMEGSMDGVRIVMVEMEDPDFEDGTVHTAHITFTNPKKQAITYKATLYLADPADINVPIASSAPQTFTIAAQGTSPAINFPVVMPLLAMSEFNFVPCCAVTVIDTPVVTFVGATLVRVYFTPAIDWEDVTWD